MNDVVIKAENLGKKYIIGHQTERGGYTALRDVIVQNARTIWNKTKDLATGTPIIQGDTVEEVWALKDVNFEIKRGEAVGIIGRNGAGKSTLLKLLSRITEPSAGRVTIKGCVASLLEVGTGFHPELTGRENIYLNGTILGMTRKEISRKFDEIVAFAEVEKFLDTPVKRYSSGMSVRLAFAVAAHLEPDILIVDEVLAVGDFEFQKKCLGKMRNVATEGRTVLFVSHNMGAVQQLCRRGVLLVDGAIEILGDDIKKVVLGYISHSGKNSNRYEWLKKENKTLSNKYFSLIRMAITDETGTALTVPIKNDSNFYLTIEFDLKDMDRSFQMGFALYNDDNGLLFWSFTTDSDENSWPKISIGRNVLSTRLQNNLLNEGSYRLMLLAACYHREWILSPDEVNPCIHFEIKGGLSSSPYWYEKRRGMLAPILTWKSVAKG
ncbi:MAG: polysaccharide ABC transporter ATP-binding protein [Pseudomonadota bacterium]